MLYIFICKKMDGTGNNQVSCPAGHISVGSEPRRGRMKGQETRRRQQDRSSDQAAKFYCSHRGIYVLRE
jgi:hypothetical protein